MSRPLTLKQDVLAREIADLTEHTCELHIQHTGRTDIYRVPHPVAERVADLERELAAISERKLRWDCIRETRYGAAMKRAPTPKIPSDAPKRIWLQHDPEDEGRLFKDAGEVTWCQDKINDSDIKYVRADLANLKGRKK